MDIKRKLMELWNKPIKTDTKAELGNLFGIIIIGVVAIVVALLLGTAILPSVITTASNTSAVSGYSTWSTGAQSMWNAVPIFAVLAYFLIFVVIVLVLMKVAEQRS